MEPRERILAQVGTVNEHDESVAVDISSLLHRLLLFEQVVVKSIRLKELPALVHAFGPDGLRLLLDEGAMRIVCEGLTVASIGPMALPSRGGVPLPLGSYAFSTVVQADRDEYLETCLREVDDAAFGYNEADELKAAVLDAILPATDPAGVEAALARDATGNHGLLVRATQRAIREARGNEPPAFDLDIRVHPLEAPPSTAVGRDVGGTDLHVETNLQRLLSIDPETEHALIERALLGLGGLNLRIAGMQFHSAIEAFQGGELPLIEDKLGFLLREVLPNDQERRLDRVLQIAGSQASTSPSLALLMRSGW